jgi:hypothetical protein
MLPDIGEILLACAVVAPTTVLINGMLFAGKQLSIANQVYVSTNVPRPHGKHP